MHSCPRLVLLPGTLYGNISTQTCFALDFFFTCITIDAYPSVALVVIIMVYINMGVRIVLSVFILFFLCYFVFSFLFVCFHFFLWCIRSSLFACVLFGFQLLVFFPQIATVNSCSVCGQKFSAFKNDLKFNVHNSLFWVILNVANSRLC